MPGGSSGPVNGAKVDAVSVWVGRLSRHLRKTVKADRRFAATPSDSVPLRGGIPSEPPRSCRMHSRSPARTHPRVPSPRPAGRTRLLLECIHTHDSHSYRFLAEVPLRPAGRLLPPAGTEPSQTRCRSLQTFGANPFSGP